MRALVVCLIVSLAAAPLCGCSESDSEAALPPASLYRPASATPPLAITFPPGDATPYGVNSASLHRLAAILPVGATPVLYAGGPLAPARAHAVASILQRPVSLQEEVGPGAVASGADVAVLTLTPRPGIVPDACRGAGGRMLGDLWPGDDRHRAYLLPPGCSTAAILQAQTTRPADLLAGRALGPGAASPYAEAIERYYERNDPHTAHGGDAGASSGGGGGGETVTPQSAAGNPLLGGLSSYSK